MNPNYPVYVISKGRWESRFTSKALEKCKIPYHIVIEPQEYDKYASEIDPKKIKVLPFSNLGQGSIPARNWVWEDSIERGFDRHWILDDNLRAFYRLHQNKKYYMTDGSGFHAIEELSDRYTNIALSGMQYEMFAPKRQKRPPLIINTRVYSIILIKNNIPYRWRGRYNEDTDLSLRALKDGCAIGRATFTMPVFTPTRGRIPWRLQYRCTNWLRLKAAILVRDGHCCRACKTKRRRLEVHHRKYYGAYIWEVAPKDLITLCSLCHEKEHAAKRKVRVIQQRSRPL